MHQNPHQPPHPCEHCGADRRHFLSQAAAIVAAIAASTGFPATALPVRLGGAGIREGDDFTYPIPAADGATIDRDNAIIVVRIAGRVCAFNLSCPHQNAAVRWRPAEARFECSKHDSVYRLDGVYVGGRATRSMDRFPVKRQGNSVVVNVATMIQSDLNKAQWEAAVVAV